VKEINPLYVVDIDTFTRVGINWTALQAGRMTEETVAYLAAFEEWVDENG
jgi:hypothetical protein